MGTPTWRVAVIGAAMGLLAVGVVVALAASGLLSGTSGTRASTDGPVLVVLVLPDENGVMVPRVIDEYEPTTRGMRVRSVDPSSAATAAGTTARTLSDVYAFGGGQALAASVAQSAGGAKRAWIVIGPDQWSSLAGAKPVRIDVPAPIDVFDGTRLFSYSQGATDVPAPAVAKLLDGAAYLTAPENKAVRQQLGDAIGQALGRAGDTVAASVESDLRAAQISSWFRMIGTPARADGT